MTKHIVRVIARGLFRSNLPAFIKENWLRLRRARKYSVIVHKRAARYLQSLTGHQRERIKKSLKDLENGINKRMDVKPMMGDWK